ncbi:MAG TPA: serine/threonine protein kinase [Burkholderiaceae bacterium]|nr:serine/threonine protein kinase [Burkholderiaceae bacterium]
MSSESNCSEPGRDGEPAPQEEPFAGLSPDAILNAIDGALRGAAERLDGVRTSGQVLALNSYENRVFQVGLETVTAHLPVAPAVVKFYRPGRWSDAQILEEHGFLEELVQAEVPAVPPVRCDGRTLHRAGAFRFAIFERRGGRAPELSDALVRERIGRFLGRLHAVGRQRPFLTRQRLDVATFAQEPSAFLLTHGWLPPELRSVYRNVVDQTLVQIGLAFERAAPVTYQRVHGDCHRGNVLWNESGAQPGPHFVDFDDSCMAPAVQDLWMLLSGDSTEMARQLRDVLRGYELFAPFDRGELLLIEALRTVRLIHYAAWIARRWRDPAFPAAFPWFGEPHYWEARILELREQIAAMREPPLEP